MEEAISHVERHGVPIELGATRYGARGEGTSLYFATSTARCSSSSSTASAQRSGTSMRS